MFSTQRRVRGGFNIWPGFVDVLATVLLTFVFILLLFVIAQFYLTGLLSDRDAALARLEGRIQSLAEELSLERGTRGRLEERVSDLYEELHATFAARDELEEQLTVSEDEAEELRVELADLEEEVEVGEETLKVKLRELASLQADIDSLRAVREDLETEVGTLAGRLEETEADLGTVRDRSKALRAELADAEERTNLAQESIEERDIRIETLVAQIAERDRALVEEERLSAEAEDRIARLRQEMRALEQQIASLADALDISEATVATQDVEIEGMAERLNLALAEKVRELSGYRSEFFGRLREVLGDIDEIRVVGDRFMFQSELFFDSASAEIGEDGREKLSRVADILLDSSERIPAGVPWVLQVEGHTDTRPIDTERYPSNWELSTARATNIVHYLIDEGIPPDRLAAAGYGEYQPIDTDPTAGAYERNRRIELGLTSR